MPRFLAELALDPEGPTPGERRAKFATFMAQRRTLAGVATNLNQAAKWANTEHELPPDFGAVVASVADAVRRVDAAIEGLER